MQVTLRIRYLDSVFVKFAPNSQQVFAGDIGYAVGGVANPEASFKIDR